MDARPKGSDRVFLLLCSLELNPDEYVNSCVEDRYPKSSPKAIHELKACTEQLVRPITIVNSFQTQAGVTYL